MGRKATVYYEVTVLGTKHLFTYKEVNKARRRFKKKKKSKKKRR